MTPHPFHAALVQAVAKADNNQSQFARRIGTSQQLVSYWLLNGRPLPGEYVLAAEAAGFGSRHDLRPDLYPRGRAKRPRKISRVAVCSISGCNRRADDPAAQCCGVRDCPFAVKEAA